jgi:predicted transcriptional regulator
MPSNAETFSIRLPDVTRKNVEKLAAMTQRSRSFIINEAVEAYVKDRLAYVSDLDKAIASADTGVGHSGAQIFDWMQSWGQADELQSPKPDLPKLR